MAQNVSPGAILNSGARACPVTNGLTGDSGCNAEAIFGTLKANGTKSQGHAKDVEFIQSHPVLKRDFERRLEVCLKRQFDCDQIAVLPPETKKVADKRFKSKAGKACGMGESLDPVTFKKDVGEVFCPKELDCDRKEHVCVLPGHHACHGHGSCPNGWVCGANDTCYRE